MPQVNTCIQCKHYKFDKTCTAFHVEIPDEIFLGDNNHTSPTSEQTNQIVFEEISNTDE